MTMMPPTPPPGMAPPPGMPSPSAGGNAAPPLPPPQNDLKLGKPLTSMLDRSSEALSNIQSRGSLSAGPDPLRTLSPQQQLAKYAARTKDTSWAKQLLDSGTVTDENGKFWLTTIVKHGWRGVSDYISAMQDLMKNPEPSPGAGGMPMPPPPPPPPMGGPGPGAGGMMGPGM